MLTAGGMLVLLVPTMAWTYIRVPGMKRAVEFLCLLPLAIPAVVLVVGIVPIYRFLSRATRGNALTLAFIDIILVLPYAHRALDAGLKSIDVTTLAEAARSLGASWPRVMFQIIAPNLRGAILSAVVITVALVLGEYTISSLLNYDTLQVVIALLGQRDAFIAVAVSLAALLLRLHPRPRHRHLRRRAPPDRTRGRSPLHDDRRADGERRAKRCLRAAAGPAPALRCAARARRSDAGARAGRARRPARAVGLRQDDGAARAGRARRAGLRRDRRRRQGHHAHAGQPPRHGHGVPGLQPVPAT